MDIKYLPDCNYQKDYKQIVIDVLRYTIIIVASFIGMYFAIITLLKTF